MKTLYLNNDSWDLELDEFGNFKLKEDKDQIAQDVASAVRVFKGECWYDNLQGMPYIESILGQNPSSAFLRAKINLAALTVPQVVATTVTRLMLVNRQLTGQILIQDSLGQTTTVNF